MDIFNYEQYEDNLRSKIGNKAANISMLHINGFNVPRGFVLSPLFTDGKNTSIKANDLIESYNKLAPPLVVRSSAVDEDSKTKSFAGIFESVLNIRTFEDYVSAIDKVYMSSKSPIHNSYSGGHSARMCVLVQELIPADHSGVIFTLNPVTGDESEVMIEYFNGLGTAVVGGFTTPHHLVIKKDTKRVAKHVASDGGLAHFPGRQGGCEEVYLHGDKVKPIDARLIDEIVETSIKIESLFGCPQDIEWAIANKKLYILQSRPVTT